MSDLYVLINKQKFPIYELDTIDTIKSRLASSLGTLPELISLTEQVEIQTSAKTISGKNFSCKAVHLAHPTLSDANPLNTRKFTSKDFTTIVSNGFMKTIAKSKNQIEAHRLFAEEIIKMFNIPDLRTYSIYVIYFIYKGLHNLENNTSMPDVTQSFMKMVDQIDIGGVSYTFDALSIEYDSEEPFITAKINKNIDSSNKNLAIFHKYEIEVKSDEDINTTDIQQTKTWLTVNFKIPVDIFELFNHFILSPEIPFIGVGYFFKVLKTFKPPSEWPPKEWPGGRNDLMFIYVLNKKGSMYIDETLQIKNDPSNYSFVIIDPKNIENDLKSTNIEMDIESKIDDELKESDLLERIYSGFPYPISDCTYRQTRIEADYMMPSPGPLDIPMFYDMVMNDIVVSSLMIINENVVTFRERGGIFAYFRFNKDVEPESNKFMAVRINTGHIETKDVARDPTLFRTLGQPYISVKMTNVPTIEETKRVRRIVNNILEYYYATAKDQIERMYTYIFPDIKDISKEFTTKKKTVTFRRELLKDIDPEMFVTDYPRFCAKAPTVLKSEEEVEEARAEGKDIMIFPLYGEGTQKVFVCNHATHPYVGLKGNKLSNKSKYPLLPCCETTDHGNDSNSKRYKYEWKYKNPDAEEELMILSEISRKSKFPLTSNKILKNKDEGLLPPSIEKFLYTLDPTAFPLYEGRYSWKREGSINDKNSVLDSIIKAVINYYGDIGDSADPKSDERLKKEYVKLLTSKCKSLDRIFNKYDKMDNAKKIALLSAIREDMVKYVAANLTSQSTYNEELAGVAKYIENNIGYLDVCLFWRILEEIFNVNIVLFQRNNTCPDGKLAAPKFLQEYLQYKRQKSVRNFTILLFETTGAEFDKPDFPQVELIKSVRYTESNGRQISNEYSWFNGKKNNIFLPRLEKAFNIIFSYDGHLNKPIPNPFVSKPIGQCSDFYGKIRFLQFADNLCILTEPLPPFDASDLNLNAISPICSFKPVSKEIAERFILLENIQQDNIIPVISDSIVTGLNCTKTVESNVYKFYIPIIPYTKSGISGVSTSPVAPTFINDSSYLDTFNRLSRQVRYLVEYIMWMFSHWHKFHKGNLADKEYIKNFAENNFVIVPDHEYPVTIPRRFDEALAGIFIHGKFAVASDDIRNRLIYSLQLKLKHNIEEVINYWQRNYIKDYYIDITDFDKQDTYIILYGKDMIKSWSKSKIPQYDLNDRVIYPNESKRSKASAIIDPDIILTEREPYFIQLENLPIPMNTMIFIAQEATDIGNALYICQTWNSQNINPGKSNKKISYKNPFIYISYNSPYEYSAQQINGNSMLIVLQFKYEEKIYTLSLLPYKRIDS